MKLSSLIARALEKNWVKAVLRTQAQTRSRANRAFGIKLRRHIGATKRRAEIGRLYAVTEPKRQDVAFALMIALSMEVRNVFGECSPQGALTEQNQLTLLFH